jgi:hypothetical protein
MGRIDCLIFSKDRPAQLDLLLRSIDRHAPNLYRSLTVLWTISSNEYLPGYETCANDHLKAWFVCELEFEGSVRDWLDSASEIVSFLVDDDVFYRDATEPLELPWSFRGGDYDYPFSLDGNVYAKADVLTLLNGLRFTDPTQLEALAHEKRGRLPFTMVAHGQPCLVGLPLNRVSVSSGMMYMGVHEYDLNERYLCGGRLSLDDIEGRGRHGLPVTHLAAFPGWESDKVPA